MNERTIMFLTAVASLTMCPAWTAESSGNGATPQVEAPTGGYPIYVPYPDKRAQLGFQGMRGKKDRELYQSLGFHGMRGKKLYVDDDDDEGMMMGEKRAAMGFHGMRGKKSEDEEDGETAYELVPLYDVLFDDGAEKRAVSGFHGMRGKRGQQGFLGMRGKKSQEQEKRAMGFHGMRGKKLNDFGFKRAQQGFLGMRGKKEDTLQDNELIRTPGEDSQLDDLLAFLTDTTDANNRFRRATPKSKPTENGLPSGAE